MIPQYFTMIVPRLRASALNFFSVLVIFASVSTIQAQTNLLTNPGAETGNYNGWSLFHNAGYNFVLANTASVVHPHTGSFSFNISGDFDFTTASNNCFQSLSCSNGQKFNAEAWAYQLSSDSFSGGNPNTAYLEVSFRDTGSNVLSRYRSRIINSSFPSNGWINLPVTNQYNPSNETLLGTVTNLVAPSNSATLRYDLVFVMVNQNSGSVYWDDMKLTKIAVPTSPSASISLSNSLPIISFPTQATFSYTVQFKNDVLGTTWSNLATSITGDGTVKKVTDTNGSALSERVYRVQVQ
jgi:hypothetical protein